MFWCIISIILVPFDVECDMETHLNQVVNVIHLNDEKPHFINGFESFASFKLELSYLYASRIEQVTRVVELSDHCEQHVEYRCKGSIISDGGFKSRSLDNDIINWVIEDKTKDCQCHLDYACNVLNRTACYCQENDANIYLVDKGFLTKKEYLPLVQVVFGDTGASVEEAYVTIGPLRCYESKDI